jgi:hypothetical protein
MAARANAEHQSAAARARKGIPALGARANRLTRPRAARKLGPPK